MGLLANYIAYNAGNECPTSYHIWSCLAAFSTVLSRRVWIDRGYFKIPPNLYVCLVGDAGSGKNIARGIASKRLIIDNFPDIPIAASVTSREDICKFMSGEECLRTFTDPVTGEPREYRPFFFSVNELANLVSVDFRKMVDFLVDLYDSEFFSTSFKHDTVKDKIPFPCATMLCGAVPDWFMRSLKMDLFSGGFGRRLTIVNENRTILIANPSLPVNHDDLWSKILDHFKAARELCGEFKLSPDADKWWKNWYEDPKRLESDDPILRQIRARKDVILQKVAILTCLDTMPFSFTIKTEHLQTSLAMLDLLEPSISKLSVGVGRNELAAVSVQFLDFLEKSGGMQEENVMKKAFFRECKTYGNEYQAMVNHLIQTEQIFVCSFNGNGKLRNFIFLPARYETFRKEHP